MEALRQIKKEYDEQQKDKNLNYWQWMFKHSLTPVMFKSILETNPSEGHLFLNKEDGYSFYANPQDPVNKIFAQNYLTELGFYWQWVNNKIYFDFPKDK